MESRRRCRGGYRGALHLGSPAVGLLVADEVDGPTSVIVVDLNRDEVRGVLVASGGDNSVS